MVTVKTVILSGAEQEVSGLGKNNTLVINNSEAPVYASNSPNVVAYEDGVIEIPVGARDTVVGTNGTVYLLGNGRVEVRGVDYVNFKRPSSSNKGDDGGIIGGTFTVASMNDDPDILHIENVPASNSRIIPEILEATGWDGVDTVPSGSYAGPILVAGQWGLQIDPHVARLMVKRNGEWVFMGNTQITSVGLPTVTIDIFQKKDLIAIGVRGSAQTTVSFAVMIAEDTNDEWHIVVLARNSSYNEYYITTDSSKATLSSNDILQRGFTDAGYSPDPTLWLSRLPTLVYADASVFRSLYFIGYSKWNQVVAGKIASNCKLTSQSETFFNTGNAFYNTPGRLFIRK